MNIVQYNIIYICYIVIHEYNTVATILYYTITHSYLYNSQALVSIAIFINILDTKHLLLSGMYNII